LEGAGPGADEIARRALGAYELAGAGLDRIRTTNNAVFEVRTETGSRFALRVHRPGFRTRAQIRSELAFLRDLHEHLAGTRVTVPRPVAARSGDLVVDVAGRRCDLLSWVEGSVLRPGRGLGLAGSRLLGEALGRIHGFAERWSPPSAFDLPSWDADAFFTKASPYRPRALRSTMSRDDWRLFQTVAEETRTVFSRLDGLPTTTGIIHADFILLNCHFVRRGRGSSVGVIDFDDLGRGYFLYDLAPLLGNLADFPGYRPRRDSFLAGYRSVRDLPVELEAYLPVLMAARHAAACLWAAGIDRSEGAGVPVREHVATRMELARACLASRS
jgi:Ser/Thr protein kinase RdoA (MazF antagonist)